MPKEKPTRKLQTKQPSPIDVYKLLPDTNCKDCGEPNCLSFAAKLLSRELQPEKCPPLLSKNNERKYKQLKKLLEPPVREVVIGVGNKAVKIGGKLAMYRHEFAYFNPTAIAIDVTDEMPQQEIVERIKRTENFSFDYIGQPLKLDMIAVRSTSNNPEKFKSTVKTVGENTRMPLLLCSLEPKVLEAGLVVARKAKPLLYAATKKNWKQTMELALKQQCPLTVSAPNDLGTLRSLTRTLMANGLKDLVLDPGTFCGDGLADTLNSFTMIRRATCKRGDELFGFPLMGTPLVAWDEKEKTREEILKWREAYATAMLMLRFADILVVHNLDGWALLPPIVLRQNIYADPRKPVAVEPGIRIFGTPNQSSPVLLTTNFALTYYTVASDLESAKTDAYLVVVNTGGIAVDSAVAGRKLTAEKIADALKTTGASGKVKHKELIIPGKAARLANDIEKLSKWHVLVGPKDSSDIPKFLKEKWQRP